MNRLGLIGKKIGMTTIYAEDGTKTPVTVLQAGPCPVIQIKDASRDGYNAVQLGFEQTRERRLNKPQKGHQQKAGSGFFRQLKEFRIDDASQYEVGQQLTVDLFATGDKVQVSGKSKGRGFAGVMKRWNFRGSPSTHGHHKVHRTPGAIGQCADPARVFKGKKMPGRMGNRKVSLSNVEVVDIRQDDHLILVRGQVPGPKNAIVVLHKQS